MSFDQQVFDHFQENKCEIFTTVHVPRRVWISSLIQLMWICNLALLQFEMLCIKQLQEAATSCCADRIQNTIKCELRDHHNDFFLNKPSLTVKKKNKKLPPFQWKEPCWWRGEKYVSLIRTVWLPLLHFMWLDTTLMSSDRQSGQYVWREKWAVLLWFWTRGRLDCKDEAHYKK